MASLPTSTDQWVLSSFSGDSALELQESVPLPALGDNDVLVKIEAVALNGRDLRIADGTYPRPGLRAPLVPLSDASCTVLATGARVPAEQFPPGTSVLAVALQGYQYGRLTALTQPTSLGAELEGTLRQYAVFPSSGLVRGPAGVSHAEACTLPGAAVTAWSALFGSDEGQGRPTRPGDWVLVQGTGAVSLFAAQFALAAGAVVVATTSGPEKAQRLKALGVRHVLLYSEDEHWGETARGLSPRGEGLDLVVDVGGPATLGQSVKAVRYEGQVAVVGYLGGMQEKGDPGLISALFGAVTVRGVVVGSKKMFEEMVRAVEGCEIKPVLDEKVWGWGEVKEAYERLRSRKQVGKVVIKIGE